MKSNKLISQNVKLLFFGCEGKACVCVCVCWHVCTLLLRAAIWLVCNSNGAGGVNSQTVTEHPVVMWVWTAVCVGEREIMSYPYLEWHMVVGASWEDVTFKLRAPVLSVCVLVQADIWLVGVTAVKQTKSQPHNSDPNHLTMCACVHVHIAV